MTHVLRQIVVLTAKDLRIEAKSRQTLALVIVLGMLIIVVLGLGLGSQQFGTAPGDGTGGGTVGGGGSGGGGTAPAVLWVAYLFGGVLCFEKTMAIERYDGALAALMLAPVDRGVIFIAKLLGNLVLMITLAVVITPVAVVMFGFDLSAAPWRFSAIVGLSFIGLASVGTLFSAAVSSSRLAGGLLAIVIFPICLPLVITTTRLMLNLYQTDASIEHAGWSVLIAFDVIYLIISWLVFELILEP